MAYEGGRVEAEDETAVGLEEVVVSEVAEGFGLVIVVACVGSGWDKGDWPRFFLSD